MKKIMVELILGILLIGGAFIFFGGSVILANWLAENHFILGMIVMGVVNYNLWKGEFSND